MQEGAAGATCSGLRKVHGPLWVVRFAVRPVHAGFPHAFPELTTHLLWALAVTRPPGHRKRAKGRESPRLLQAQPDQISRPIPYRGSKAQCDLCFSPPLLELTSFSHTRMCSISKASSPSSPKKDVHAPSSKSLPAASSR